MGQSRSMAACSAFCLALLGALGSAPAGATAPPCEVVMWSVEVSDLPLPPDQDLYMAGSLAALGPWDAQSGNRFQPLGAGRWLLTLQVPPAADLEFKLLQRASQGGQPRWESHQLTPSRNRLARTPACGDGPSVLRLRGFDDRPDPLAAEQAGAAYRDELWPAGAPAGLTALAAALALGPDAAWMPHLERAVDAQALPAAQLAAPLRAFLQKTGGLELLGRRWVEGADPDTWLLLARTRHAEQTLLLPVRWTEKGRVSGLQLPHPAQRVRPRAEPPLSPKALPVALKALMQRVCASGAFSGAVELARAGQPHFSHACGVANRRDDVPNRLFTRFNLASQNKMFTAVRVLQLVEQGRLSLDDRLDRFLGPEWLAPEVAQRISVRQLLMHRSGLGSYFDGAFFKSSRDLYRELSDFQPLVRGSQPAFEPGAHFAYSNTGYLLLGAVIEQAGGASYFEQIRHHVFAPAGMTRAGYEPMDVPVTGLAQHYVAGAPGSGHAWLDTAFLHVFRGGPAGGGYASVGDLTRFADALQRGRLLKPESLALAWPRDGSHYGLGFELGTGALGFVVGHGGGFPGINAQLDIHPEGGWSVAALSNTEGGMASQLALRMAELVRRVSAGAR
jgi:CubicO group peptidase (beta-lactamase class C family)